MSYDPANWNPDPDMRLFHKFIGKGKKILAMYSFSGKLFIQLERGLYYFANMNSRPRRIA